MDRGACQATVHRVTKSQKWLKQFRTHTIFSIPTHKTRAVIFSFFSLTQPWCTHCWNSFLLFLFLFGHITRHMDLQIGIELCPLQWKLRVLTTGLPGTCLLFSFFITNLLEILLPYILLDFLTPWVHLVWLTLFFNICFSCPCTNTHTHTYTHTLNYIWLMLDAQYSL